MQAINTRIRDTQEKALRINLDPRRYGTFAEIGAGQEVVRWFFRVGGAAGELIGQLLGVAGVLGSLELHYAVVGRAGKAVGERFGELMPRAGAVGIVDNGD